MVTIQETKKYQAYYTKSTPIVDYMVNKLELKESDRILEPCGGDGVFVDSILALNESANIDVYELNDLAFQILLNKFSPFGNVTIRNCDTLLDNDLIFNSGFGGAYDKIIANPPYGAWQDFEKRSVLKKLYNDLYAKETYSLFLYRCIELLRDGGILSFIIPDTFLNLHMHKGIRRNILTKTRILELVLFPSSFFPGVNFGYANLSIITLQKDDRPQVCLTNEFPVFTKFSDVSQLANIENQNVHKFSFVQSEVLANSDHAFFIAEDSTISDTLSKAPTKLGDIASCVTGFYSGDDKTFLQVRSLELKNGKNYTLVNPESICDNITEHTNILDGIDGLRHFIPIVKGGNTRYLKPESWFMNWSKEAVSHYKNDKKARFQNPKFYFKFGIGVPMISSSSITASLIENKLFDQSIVGVFPSDPNMMQYLLGFLNSPTCNKLIRTINPSANNPANYIKKIPFIHPDEKSLKRVTDLVGEIINSIKLNKNYDEEVEREIHTMFQTIYGF